MGVRTRIFGPRAWVFFEGMAVVYDQFMEYEKNEKKRIKMKRYFQEFLFLIGFVIPCIYCRISYQSFTNPKKPYVDIKKLVNMKDGGKKAVYELHCQVNNKLWEQEKEKNQDNPETLRHINQKWISYNISFNEALQTRFKPAYTYEFWYSTVVFLALVMCDYSKDECPNYFRFFYLIGKILTLSVDKRVIYFGLHYQQCLQDSADMWKPDMSFKRRIGIVWCIIKKIFIAQHWKFNHDLKSFEDQCKKSIVGC